LTRGNPFANKISIGGVSPLVPPLPGKIDGPVTGGIAKHGRFEGVDRKSVLHFVFLFSLMAGDASMTRADAFIGDNRNFQDILYDLVNWFFLFNFFIVLNLSVFRTYYSLENLEVTVRMGRALCSISRPSSESKNKTS
jgi:hypothetical protein